MKDLSVSEAAQRCGLSGYAVRFYDDAGLIPGVERDGSGHRLFGGESLAWLEFVVCLRAVGMPIASIRNYVIAVSSGLSEEALVVMRDHLDELRLRRDQLDTYIAMIDRKLDVHRGGKSASG